MLICYALIVKEMKRGMKTSNKNFRNANTEEISKERIILQNRLFKYCRYDVILCSLMTTSFIIFWIPFHTVHLVKIQGISNGTVSTKISIICGATKMFQEFIKTKCNGVIGELHNVL